MIMKKQNVPIDDDKGCEQTMCDGFGTNKAGIEEKISTEMHAGVLKHSKPNASLKTDNNRIKKRIESIIYKFYKKSHNIFWRTKKCVFSVVKTAVKKANQSSGNFRLYLKRSGIIHRIKSKKRLVTIVSVGGFIFLFVLIGYIFLHSTSKPNGPNVYNNLLRINAVQTELSKLQVQLTTTSQLDNKQKMIIEGKLQDIDSKLSEVSKGSGARQQKQIKALRATIQSANVGLYQKVNALNKEVAQLKQKVSPAPTLSPTVLPFVVQDVDTWNGQPFAQITQKANETMVSYVGLYQHTGIWKVIEINAHEQTVTFINRHGQVVHVQVKQF